MFSHRNKNISFTRKQIRPGLTAVCLLGITLCLAQAASARTQVLILTLNNSLSASAARLLNGTSSGFTATAVTRPHSTDVTGLVRSWSSSNPAVATIDSTGHVTAHSPGSTIITASIKPSLGGSTVLSVTAIQPPTYVVQPSSTSVSATIVPAVQLEVEDNLGDLLAGLNVTVSIGTNAAVGGTGTLSGTLAHPTNAGGVATFSDLKIDWVGAGYTLVANVTTPTTPVSAVSATFNEIRVGDVCLGPNPECSSGCADTEGDGLNDAWEEAVGIDINGDGLITDAIHDVLLPGADSNTPDVYVKYDYMVASTPSIFAGPHSHQPPLAAIQQVVDAFASHGVNLHIDPQHDAIPEVQVTTLDSDPTLACAGPNFVTVKTLRQRYFGNRKWAYHYCVFAHNAVLPDTALDGRNCPADRECAGFFDPLGSGVSEMPGSSFIVAFGADVDQGFTIGIETWAGTFMHELGHNLGLKHGSLAAPAPQSCITTKPNYISVMGYTYQNGIAIAAAPGSITHLSCNSDSDCPAGNHCTDDLGSPVSGGNVCYYVDYSGERLIDLNEASLNELLGVGGPIGDSDIVTYCANAVGCALHGPANGPIDWNNSGSPTETDVQGDIDNDNGVANTIILTANDWEMAGGLFTYLNFKFQCTAAYLNDGGAPVSVTERGLNWARENHVLYPSMSIDMVISPGCSEKEISANPVATAKVALLGSERFDVNQVDVTSLHFHGARPIDVSFADVNDDGIPDLLLGFLGADVHLSPHVTRVRMNGWLKNSRAFMGEDAVKVVPATQALSCTRNISRRIF